MAVRAAVKARWKRGCGGETLRRFRSHWPGLTKPPAAGIDDPSVRPAAPPESVESAAGPSRLAGLRGARVTPASGTTEQTRKERATPTCAPPRHSRPNMLRTARHRLGLPPEYPYPARVKLALLDAERRPVLPAAAS